MFSEDTKILMANGEEKLIRHLALGDEIRCSDNSVEPILALTEPRYAVVYVVICADKKNVKRALYVTPDTPMLDVNGNDIPLDSLRIGTELQQAGKVRGVAESGERRCCDFEITEGKHCFANGFII